MKRIEELMEEAYATAKKHGWHDEKQKREHYMMLMICEVAEAVEADRIGRHARVDLYKRDVDDALMEKKLYGEALEELEKESFCIHIKDSVEDELADVVIRLFDYCSMRKIKLNVNEELVKKMAQIYKRCRTKFTEFSWNVCSMISLLAMLKGKNVERDRFTYVLTLVEAWCVAHDIDLQLHVEWKMKYNKLREWKHGKKY